MAGAGSPGLSLMTDYGEHGSSCGYCGSKGPTSISHGMMAESLSVECYQELLDRGWRRSGCWVYCPLHDRSCCQLLTIRLDVTRFAPNKEQRRVQRKWQAYLEGAPMRADQATVAGHHQQEQQNLDSSSRQHGQEQGHPPASSSGQQPRGGEAPAGGSPKRPHDEMADALQWGHPEHWQPGSLGNAAAVATSAAVEEGGGKRHRQLSTSQFQCQLDSQSSTQLTSTHEEEVGLDARLPRGGSPTAQLRDQLRQALGNSLLGAPTEHQNGLDQAEAALLGANLSGSATHSGSFSQHQGQGQQPEGRQTIETGQQQQGQRLEQVSKQQQGQAPPPAAAAGAAASTNEAGLTCLLAKALQQALAAGLLPVAPYPAPKVQQPTVKQRKLLAPQVTFTTAWPLAVAAVASKFQQAAAGGGNNASRLSAEMVAELLLQRMPAELAAGAEVAKGHINFAAPAAAAEQHAAATMAVSTAASTHSLNQRTSGSSSRQHTSQPSHAANTATPTAGSAAAARADAAATAVPRGVPRHFELRTLPSSEPSLTQVEFQLFKKYQVIHHGDKPSEVTPRSFRRFLVESPLRPAGPDQYPPGGCPPTGFGSFHQQYWLDGRLVAVGVVDVLPRCLSSKYLFWDPDLAPLSLGKLTSLKEIEWVRDHQASCPNLRYYYLGFYIHNCHRMRYKGDFAPSDLLCPQNKCWVPLARVQAALDQPGMVAISELPGALEGLGDDHGVDPATNRPAHPPREPTEAELGSFKFVLKLPGAEGGAPQARVVPLRLLRQLGMLGDHAAQRQLKRWWNRAGPAAAAMTAFAVD